MKPLREIETEELEKALPRLRIRRDELRDQLHYIQEAGKVLANDIDALTHEIVNMTMELSVREHGNHT
jgi:predicted  nucleic acid-binding Zn-ribbon protein